MTEQIREDHRARENESDDGVAGNIVPASDLRNIFHGCDTDQKNCAQKIREKRDGNRARDEQHAAPD